MQQVVNRAVAAGVILLLGGAFFMAAGLLGPRAGLAFFKQAPVQVTDGDGQTAAPPPTDAAAATAPLEPSEVTAATRVSYLYAGRKVGILADGQLQFVHQDRVGTASAVTDADGAVASLSRQLPFGQQLGETTRETDFTGKKTDGGTGLDYFGARYYAQSVGRFGSADPVLVPGWSLYDYAKAAPLKWTDPTGRRIQGGQFEAVETGIGDSRVVMFQPYWSDRPWWHPEQVIAFGGSILPTLATMVLGVAAIPDVALAATGADENERQGIYASLMVLGPEMKAAQVNAWFVGRLAGARIGAARAAAALKRLPTFERNDYGWAADAAAGLSEVEIAKGFNPADRLFIVDGRVMDANGKVHKSGIWVVTENGELRLGIRGGARAPHSQLAGGGGVKGAGEFGVHRDGRLKWANTKTGHYNKLDDPAFNSNSMEAFRLTGGSIEHGDGGARFYLGTMRSD